MTSDDSLFFGHLFFFFYYGINFLLCTWFLYKFYKYLKNSENFKLHKLDVLTFILLLIYFPTYIILSLSNDDKVLNFFMTLFNYLSLYILTVIFSNLMIIVVNSKYLGHFKVMNYVITFITFTVILIILISIDCDIYSFEDNKLGKIIKYIMFIIEFILELFSVLSYFYMSFQEIKEETFVLVVSEEDMYINHICASMIRRTKELSKTYLIIVVIFLLRKATDFLLIWVYDNDIIIKIVLKEHYCDEKSAKEFTFELFYTYLNIFIIKDILPFLLIILFTLVFRKE